MRINKKIGRNHEGIQYYRITPIPEPGEERLLDNWKEYLDKHNAILHTFYDEIDPVLTKVMKKERGESWDYVPLEEADEQWPRSFLIYENKKVK